MSKYKKGDKFIIEIEHIAEVDGKAKYFIKGFNACVFDDNGLDRLMRHQKEMVDDTEEIQMGDYIMLMDNAKFYTAYTSWINENVSPDTYRYMFDYLRTPKKRGVYQVIAVKDAYVYALDIKEKRAYLVDIGGCIKIRPAEIYGYQDKLEGENDEV